jgi:hypothetical protein
MMMKRRTFIKSLGAAGASAFMPSTFNLASMYKQANAAVNYAGASVTAPAVMPQVINVFLYGGPSELSGNLTNIQDIENNSQNSYANAFGDRILTFDTDGTAVNGFITPHGFWRGNPDNNNPAFDGSGAGGRYMQSMLERGQMSVYRTLMKRLDGTRSHRESLLMSQKGSLDIEVGPGVGTRLAATLFQHRAQFEATSYLADGNAIGGLTSGTSSGVEALFLPFVSFEGDTRYFQQDPDFMLPLLLRGMTLDQNLESPYSRNRDDDPIKTALNSLVGKVMSPAMMSRYSGVVDAFALREFFEDKMAGLDPRNDPDNIKQVTVNTDSSGDPLPNITDAADAASIGIAAGAQLFYPNNRYTDRIRAAVTLALKNPSSLYITVGGGLGGWDDHNNGIDNYPDRMNDLFAVMQAAMLHIKYYNGPTLPATPGGTPGTRTTNSNIAINMFGDFGRLVNLNNSEGWDHGNNQNLYTFGIAGTGSPRPAGALGKVVGTTQRTGDSGTNNQVTEPVPGSYEAEPMSVAATVYSYFGVQNPEILTADDERNPAGVPAIDETVAGEPPLFP